MGWMYVNMTVEILLVNNKQKIIVFWWQWRVREFEQLLVWSHLPIGLQLFFHYSCKFFFNHVQTEGPVGINSKYIYIFRNTTVLGLTGYMDAGLVTIFA